MKVVRAFLAAAATAAAAAMLILVILPKIGGTMPYSKAPHVAAFHPDKTTKLGTGNIVDAMVAQSFVDRLKRVEMKGNVLLVDFLVVESEANPEALQGDLLKLIKLSFFQLDNIDRLLVRFIERADSGIGGSSGYKLLMASDVRRSDMWLKDGIGELEGASALTEERWKQRLRLSFSSGWLQRFGED